MNGLSKVIIRVKFNCMTATQGAHRAHHHSFSSLWVSRTGSASDCCAFQEALYKCIDTIQYYSAYFYSTSSSPLLLRGAPNTARILCRSLTLKCRRQLRVKDLPKVPMWQLEQDSNP